MIRYKQRCVNWQGKLKRFPFFAQTDTKLTFVKSNDHIKRERIKSYGILYQISQQLVEMGSLKQTTDES